MRPVILVLLLAGACAATPAWSAPRLAPVSPPPVANAGDWYETRLPGLPPGTDEVELVLVPDDGRAVQLSPEQQVPGGPLRWRMPHTTCRHARLVLRAGGPWGEIESEPSAAFAVRPDLPPALAELLRGRAELAWQFGDGATAAGPALWPPGAATYGEGGPLAATAGDESSPEAGLPGRASFVLVSTDVGAPPFRAAAPHSRQPRFVPLRN
jgi:hypothetical protein